MRIANGGVRTLVVSAQQDFAADKRRSFVEPGDSKQYPRPVWITSSGACSIVVTKSEPEGEES